MSTPDAAPELPPLPSNPDENEGAHVLGAVLSTTCLALILLATRVYVRTFMVKALGWDDYFMILAMALSIATASVIAASVRYGAGQHIGDLDPGVYMTGMKLNFISQGMLQWALCLVKISVGCALLRIATQKRWRYPIMGITVFMVIYTIGCFTTLFTQCEQVAMQWDPSIPRACWAPETLQGLAFTHAALNIFTDFVFAVVIPIPLLWNLQMNRRTKGAVMAVLALGLFVCLAGILRIPEIVNYGKTGDFLWDSVGLSIWFMAEINTGIMAGSIPALKPLFKSVLSTTYFQGRSQKYGGYGAHTSGTANHQHTFSSKGYNNLTTERAGSESQEQFNDSDGSLSQKGLVISQRPIELGVIQKDVTTTITSVDKPRGNRPRSQAWDV